MRTGTALLIAAALVAVPAAAQQPAGDTTGVDAVQANNADPSLAGNTIDPLAGADPQMNGLAATPGTPANATTALPPVTADPLATETAAATPARGGERGFPWGLLGVLGLAGLLGRSRRARADREG